MNEDLEAWIVTLEAGWLVRLQAKRMTHFWVWSGEGEVG